MNHKIFILLLISFLTFEDDLLAQKTIQIEDMELINLGDGQLFGKKNGKDKDAEKEPINGKTRIITGFTNQYIDAEFSEGKAMGTWEYYEEGELTGSTYYEDGYKEGEAYIIVNKDKSSCYKKTEFYKKGKLDGNYTEVFCDGEPKVSGKYIAGKKHGVWEYFKKDGKRDKPYEEYDNGDLIKKISYYTNGQIEKEQSFKNGKENGTTKQYTQEGTLKSEKNYVLGKQVGKQMQYYTHNHNDFIETSNYSAEGKKDGEFLETYVKDNAIKTKGKYINGEKEGKWITYSPDGQYIKETDYSKGKETGSKKIEKKPEHFSYPAYTLIEYYDATGARTGEYLETYDATKKIKKKGQYVNGRQHGKWVSYDKDGKLIREEIYENGVLKMN